MSQALLWATTVSCPQGHHLSRPGKIIMAGPHTFQAGPDHRSRMPTLYTTAGPKSWLTMSYQLMSLLSGSWLHNPGSRGRKSSSSGHPRVQENLLGQQAAASQGKRSAIACRLSHCPRVLRMATTFHSLHHSPHLSPMVTSGTGRRAEKATHHLRDMASLPWWSMKWFGTCLPCWGLRATWCL